MICGFFDNITELEEITGKTDQELWDLGFDLDDCDGGFYLEKNAQTKKWLHSEEDEWGYTNIEPTWDTCPTMLRLMIEAADDYCVGYRANVYDGNYYFLIYHA